MKSFQACRVLEWFDDGRTKKYKTRNCKPHMMKPCLVGANYVDISKLKSMPSSIAFLFEMFETFPTWTPHPVEADQEADMQMPLPAEKRRGNVSTRKTNLDNFRNFKGVLAMTILNISDFTTYLRKHLQKDLYLGICWDRAAKPQHELPTKPFCI